MGIQGKFLGDTKGNRVQNHNLTDGGQGGAGESHAGGAGSGSKFLGSTKGNTNLPPNRTAGVSGSRSTKAGGK